MLGRFGQPDDIARVAVFLASEDSAWLTGERPTASGGYRFWCGLRCSAEHRDDEFPPPHGALKPRTTLPHPTM
jgi:hypothetical protein